MLLREYFDFLAIPPKVFLVKEGFPEWWDFEKPYMVQAKTNGYVKPIERQTLINSQERYNGFAIIAYKDDKRKTQFKRVSDLKP